MGGWQVGNEELWNKTGYNQPGGAEIRRLVGPTTPASPSQPYEQAASNCTEKDHAGLVRVHAAVRRSANSQNEHREGQDCEGELNVLLVDFAGQDDDVVEFVLHGAFPL